MNKAATSEAEDLLRRTYASFNDKDVNTVLEAMHEDVDWPNMIDGNRAHGHEEVRAYWARQFGQIDSHAEPQEMTLDPEGRVVVDVRQVIHAKDGSLLDDRMIRHVFTMREGLIVQMDVISL